MNKTLALTGAWQEFAMPLLFVVIWSTGFIVARVGLPFAPPLSFLLLRYCCVIAVLAPLLLMVRPSWPRGQVLHIALAGVMVQAGYLSGVWCAIKLGMPAGLSALIVGLQPLLTALVASLAGESLRWRQWLGLLLGLAGVALVVVERLSFEGSSTLNLSLCVFALFCITAGTLYQKRFCPRFDLRLGAVIQFGASALVTLPFALWLEVLGTGSQTIQWTPQFLLALAWSVLALSIGAMFLLYRLIASNAATQVSSLMYLTPPVTALFAWLLFGEAFGQAGIAGMLLAAAGVACVVRR